MMPKISAVAIVAALVAVVNADAYHLHATKTAQAPWELSKVQPPVNLREEVHMNIGLKRRNVDLLEGILLEVSDPKSHRYGEHLSELQLRNLVGSSVKSIDEVKSWLARHGIAADQVVVSAHHDALKFVATRAQVSSLLKVQWATYENSVSAQTSVRALGSTEIPDHLAQVVEMVAGHRGWPMQMQPQHSTSKKKEDLLSNNADVTPDLIYQVYQETNIPTTPIGQTNLQSFFQAAGQAVSPSDLTQFCNTYLTHGFNGTCAIAKFVGGHDGASPGIESSLDSQYIIATSFGAETWAYTYNNQDFCSDLLSWAQDVFGESGSPHPNVVSMSYGSQSLPTYCEGTGAQRMNEDTMKMGAAGISVIIASGDMGSGEYSRAGFNNGHLAPSFPAELPYVTAVGSTTFVSGNSGTQRATSFSGGGFSWTWGAPSYQQSQIHSFLTSSTQLPTAAQYNSTGRGTPDVSFLGEGFNVINGGSLVPRPGVAGTSCSTPSFAGMVTLLNNVRLEQGKTLGFLNPLLYSNPMGFTDITAGSNANGHEGSGFHAKSGWDASTGLGTPVFSELVSIVKALNHGGTPVPMTPMPPSPPVTPAPQHHDTPAPLSPSTPNPEHHYTPSPGGGGKKYTALVCSDDRCNNCREHEYYSGECAWEESWSFKAWCEESKSGQLRTGGGSSSVSVDIFGEAKCAGRYTKKSTFSDYCFAVGTEGATSAPRGTHLKIRCPR